MKISNFRFFMLLLSIVVLLVVGVGFVKSKRAFQKTEGGEIKIPSDHATQNDPSTTKQKQLSINYSLEVRGLGVTSADLVNHEIWQTLKKQSNPHKTFISQDPGNYPFDSMAQSDNATVTSGLAFKAAAEHAVKKWPVPTLIVLPPLGNDTEAIPGAWIPGLRQQAGLAAHLLIDQGGISTDDGADIWHKVFELFDQHPDLPEIIIFTGDGETVRVGQGDLKDPFKNGHRVPSMPDTFSAFLVARSNNVDARLRSYVVEEPEDASPMDMNYDINKLWQFFWHKNDGQGSDSYQAYWRDHIRPKSWSSAMDSGPMTTTWWQMQLPSFWQTLKKQKNGFLFSNYLPLPWTNWQLAQFDQAPIIGFIHRPVTVDLKNAEGKKLTATEKIERLENGFLTATSFLDASSTSPARIFFDTFDDKNWIIPLSRSIDAATHSKIDLTNVSEGFDIGTRIGNTGVNSTSLQMGLGLISSYMDGGVSVSITRRPNEKVDFTILTPPSDSIKLQVNAKAKENNPFVP